MAVAKDTCPECLGSGWNVQVQEGVRRAVRCACHRSRVVANLEEAAGIPPRFEHCSLEAYEPQNHSQKAALARARELADLYPAVDRGLMLLGPCGVGKTHLAVGLARELIRQKQATVRFADYSALLRGIQSSYGPDARHSEAELLRPYLQAEVMILDDLGGARRPSPWVFDTLFHILNSRYNHRRLTVLTSNFEDVEVEDDDPRVPPEVRENALRTRVGERLRSRLYEMCDVLHVDGQDWRRKNPAGPAR